MTITQRQRKPLYKRRIRPNSAHIIVLGFLGVILFGAFLLCLPISARDHRWMNYLDGIFTATSAVSTTGLLVTGDTAMHFSAFGQAILLILIQFGGVGFMCITTLFMLLLRRKITLRDRLLMRTEFNQNDNRGMVRLGRNIMIVTLIIEGVGFLLLLYPFVARNGAIGIWQALFTSVSAFCNAGFDVMGVTQGAGTSLMGFAGNVMVNLSVSMLIVLGGLGFTVLMDVGHNKLNFRKLTVHSKIAIITSLALILFGWVFYFGAEFHNAGTMGNKSIGDKILISFFQSVTPRSTGFATVEQSSLTPASKFVTIILMFIGASPGSTGGGIRTTTFVILLLVMVAGIRGNDDVTVRKRKIDPHVTRKATGVFTSSLAVVILSSIMLLFTEKGHAPQDVLTLENVLFEAISAYTTAGLSCGISATLSVGGKIILCFLMFFGRVGMVTIGLMFLRKRGIDDRIGYPDANIMVG